jgi:hypothetical protein
MFGESAFTSIVARLVHGSMLHLRFLVVPAFALVFLFGWMPDSSDAQSRDVSSDKSLKLLLITSDATGIRTAGRPSRLDRCQRGR